MSKFLGFYDGIYQDSWFVGKHGNDSNDGTTLNKPFITFGEAIGAASSGDTIMCLDGGTYTERLTVPAGIDIFAPAARLVGIGGGGNTMGALNVNDGSYTFCTITNGTGESCIVKPDTSDTVRINVKEIFVNANGTPTGVLNSSTTQGGVIILEAEQIHVGASCTGVGSTSVNTAHTHVEVEKISLEGDGAIGIGQTGASSTMVVRVGHILEDGSVGATTAISVQNGRIDATVCVINADVNWNVGASGTLSIFYNLSTGVPVVAGTILTSTPA